MESEAVSNFFSQAGAGGKSRPTHDLRLLKGSTSVLYGPSASGKTYRVANILRNKNVVIKEGESIRNVVFCYSAWQPIYSELQQENVVTKWVNYMPNSEQFRSLAESHVSEGGTIMVVDDFMTSLSKDLVQIICVDARHYNVTLFVLFQSLFPANPLARQISLNAKYLWISKNPRENSQIKHVCRQIQPLSWTWIVHAFYDATSKPYGYLLFDLNQETPDFLRFRSNVLPSEAPMVVYRPPDHGL